MTAIIARHSNTAREGIEESDYAQYLRLEWQLFMREPARWRAILDALGGVGATRVLDIGSGAAQELLPLLETSPLLAVAIDRAPEASIVARDLYANRSFAGRIAFVRAQAEGLPCVSSTFDCVICRLALPYTSNAAALAEMARVLRTGGLVLLQFHHARFYVHELIKAVSSLSPRHAVHNAAVLVAGSAYWATGKQPRARLIGGEVFQTLGMLRREAERCGLRLRNQTSNSNPWTPSVILVKH